MDDHRTVPASESRRAYQKPQVTRVDVVEDEIALASCKLPFSGPRNSSGVTTNGTCRTSCMVQSST